MTTDFPLWNSAKSKLICAFCKKEYVTKNSRGSRFCPDCQPHAQTIMRVASGQNLDTLSEEKRRRIYKDKTTRYNARAWNPKFPHALEPNHPDYGKGVEK
jgi:hypothetical protein